MALVLALLAATAVAFAITEGAKLEKSPIAGTDVTKTFSPAGVTTKVAHVDFRLRTRERLEVWIRDSHGERVRTLLTRRNVRSGTHLDLVWDGFTDRGTVAPDGAYMPVVKLERSHRTVVLPNEIQLDTQPPVVTVKHPQYPILSPDGDNHGDAFRIHYSFNEPAHAILLLRGTQVLFTRTSKESGVLVWRGRVNGGARVRPGRYLLSLAARDTAGNISKGFRFAIVQIRYVVLARSRVVVRPGGRFALRVSTDAPQVHWRLHGRSGVQPRGTLHFRAPRKIGVYRLYVSVGTHSAKCAVVVA